MPPPRVEESRFKINPLTGEVTLGDIEEDMAKPVIHVGLGMVWSGVWEGSLYRLAATTGERDFTVNLAGPKIDMPGMYVDYPEVWQASLVNPKSLAEGLGEFVTWLQNFRGRVVGIGEVKDFSRLAILMKSTVGRVPFGDSLLDVRSWVAARQSDPNMGKKWDQKFIRYSEVERYSLDPLERAKNNLWTVRTGTPKELPVAKLASKPAPKKKTGTYWGAVPQAPLRYTGTPTNPMVIGDTFTFEPPPTPVMPPPPTPPVTAARLREIQEMFNQVPLWDRLPR